MSMSESFSLNDILEVLYHGLPLDLSMSGYLSVLPALFLILSIWFNPKAIAKICNIYFSFVLSLITIVSIADIFIYPHWGFHFDSTVFFYLKNPEEAIGSGSATEIFAGILLSAIFISIIYLGYSYIIKRQILKLKIPKSIGKTCLVMIVLMAMLILPIRGGLSVSTMNVGKVYFSDNMFLNHAAVNPHFNLMYSFFKSEDFASQYQFFNKQEAIRIFDELNKQPKNDSIIKLLNTDKPNIIFFILESFSANVANDSLIAPNMNKFAKEGISFKNFYANSFRTDRGLVSILSGYPAHPTTAIMKYPQKTQSLPAIPASLKESGYNLSFYYGGDADFANMRSYFVGSCMICDITSEEEFPLSDRLTKWGVPDQILIDRVYSDLIEKQPKEPFMKTVLTLSSHEPFDVPSKGFDEPFINAVAYTDSCLGSFVDKLKTTELWKNTLIVLVADHCMQSYPSGVDNNSPERFRIPMIWLGGAVKAPADVLDYGSQNDIAATLLSQMNINHSDFKFSKNMFNPDANKFAFYSYVNGFSMVNIDGSIIYDNDKNSIIEQSGDKTLEKKAKAFFQNMYLDLGSR